MKIRDLAVGDTVKMLRLVASDASIRQTKTKKDYLAVTFTDGTDKISGNMWDYNKNTTPMLIVGTVYAVSGIIGEYMGTKQLTPTEILEPIDQDKSEFMPVATTEIEDIYNALLERINRIGDSELRALLQYIFVNNEYGIKHATAAKDMHHVGDGGTLLHTSEVLAYADDITLIARVAHGLDINRDLVTAGALLHDIGKLLTYGGGMPVYEYTEEGMLLDHITLGIQLVSDAAHAMETKIETHKLNLLLHIIAAHHGKLEYGSPVIPICVEAIIVNRADGLSADFNTLAAAFTKAGTNEMTDRVYTLGNRPFFTDAAIQARMKGELS